jgi:ureidoglycolate hydrolase
MNGLGTTTVWGTSIALDLLENNTTEDVNILLLSSGDPRHVLKTISRLWRHPIKTTVPQVN